jgi:hypothetical protein
VSCARRASVLSLFHCSLSLLLLKADHSGKSKQSCSNRPSSWYQKCSTIRLHSFNSRNLVTILIPFHPNTHCYLTPCFQTRLYIRLPPRSISVLVVSTFNSSWYYTDSVTHASVQGNNRSLTRSMDAYMQQPYYAACQL